MLSRIYLFIFILIMTIVISCQKTSPINYRLSEQDITNIHFFFKSHQENALSADWVADALLYTEDAVRYPPGGDPIQGREAIQQALETIDSVLSFNPEIMEVDGCGDLAYTLVKYSFTSILVGSSEPVVSSGKSLMILKKQENNSWKFHRVMWN
jgi:ketosteroid isomerase-like protein